MFALVDGRYESRLTLLGAANAPIEIAQAQLTDGPWCPDAGAPKRFDVDFFEYDASDSRFESRPRSRASRSVGPLFLRGGTARAGRRYVPDLEIQLDVTPRN